MLFFSKLFSRIRRKMRENRYRRQHLNIIESIPETQFMDILGQLEQQGWELTDKKQKKTAGTVKQIWVIRKGTSKLEFVYSSDKQGSISGMQRIVKGIADKHALVALNAPSDA